MPPPKPSAAALAADDAESRGADAGGAEEHQLWRGILRRVVADLLASAEQTCQNAVDFLRGPDLLWALDLAGIDRDLAPTIRNKAMIMLFHPPPGRLRIDSIERILAMPPQKASQRGLR